MTERKKIMLVDDNITNLTVGRNVLHETYDVFTIPSGQKLFQVLERTIPDLILLDIEMPDMNGYEVIKRLKESDKTKNIPVIFLTAKQDDVSELEGLSLGAVDFISKPFSPMLLKKRIELQLLLQDQRTELQQYNTSLQEMVQKKTKTVLTLQNAVLQTVAELVEYRDNITGGHIERTQYYLRILLKAMLENEVYSDIVAEWDYDFFYQSAQLHDVGKIAIKDSILQKPGKLTPQEFDEMKTHTTFGGKVIEKISKNTEEKMFLQHAKIFAETHHEKWDGSGYPNGLKGEKIPLQGRMMAIVDVYDALISERPYKEVLSHSDAVSIIASGRGTHFDPTLVDLFLLIHPQFEQVGKITGSDLLGLSTGEILELKLYPAPPEKK